VASAQPTLPQDAQFQFGKSFDCSRTGQDIPSLVCQSRDLQLLDLHQLQAYYTLRHAQRERQQEFRNQFTVRIQGLVRECSSEELRARGSQPTCVEQALRDLRNVWVQQIQLTGNAAALEEIRHPVAQFWNGQLALRSRGFLPAGSGIDGLFGSGTRDALSRFQSERGIPITGFLTSATAAALQVVSTTSAPPTPLARIQQIAENLSNAATSSEQVTQQNQQKLSDLDRQFRAGQITETQYRNQTASMSEDVQLMRQTADQARDVRQRLQASTQQSPQLASEEAKIHQAQRRLEVAADGLEAAINSINLQVAAGSGAGRGTARHAQTDTTSAPTERVTSTGSTPQSASAPSAPVPPIVVAPSGSPSGSSTSPNSTLPSNQNNGFQGRELSTSQASIELENEKRNCLRGNDQKTCDFMFIINSGILIFGAAERCLGQPDFSRQFRTLSQPWISRLADQETIGARRIFVSKLHADLSAGGRVPVRGQFLQIECRHVRANSQLFSQQARDLLPLVALAFGH
jgi:peptidoglycan hydrolase-like protein with peptidoglycan-binding domain